MGKHNRVPRWAALAAAVAGAMLGLAILIASLAGGTTWAAPLRAGSGNDPHIAAITLTADLPISDTCPGDGLDKTVYFSNAAPGVMTLTFEISGTPTLTLAAGAAFDTPTAVYTSDNPLWTPVVTYFVAATQTHQPNVAYTVINTDAQATTVTITYVQDITAPTTIIVHPPPGYFTGTQLVITGTASDDAGGAGVQWVYVMTETTWMTATGTTDWAYTATFPITDGVPYTLSARAIDFLGTVGAGATRAITVDNVPPRNPSFLASTVPTATWKNVSAIPITWTAGSDGSGGLVYYYALTTTWPYTVGAGSPFTSALAVTPTIVVDGVYTFALRSRDGAGNWATDTLYLGPFFKDSTSPAVSITLPAARSLLTTTHRPTCTIGGTASDPHPSSGLAVVSVTTGLDWYTATGTDVWAYTWTLPIADDVVYTLTARAGDNAGNLGESPAVTVTVDTVAPSAAAPSPHRSPWVTSTVVYTWPTSGDGAGIAGYRVKITNTAGYAGSFWSEASILTFTQAFSEGKGYYAWVQAVDGVGNTGEWSGASGVVTPDLTAPAISSPAIVAPSDYFCISGLALFYTNTMTSAQTFHVQGNASDGGPSGLERAAFSEAFGQTPGDDTSPNAFSGSYDVSPGETESGVITTTIYDRAGNTAVQTYTCELDGTPPTSTAWAPSFAITRPITVTWAATDTQSGVYSTTLWYKKEITGTWTSYQTLNAASGVFNFDPPDGDGLYLFATVAADNLGNQEPAPTISETQTTYDTRLPRSQVTWASQYRNSSPITVTWVATPSRAALVEVRLWYRFESTAWASTTITGVAESGTFTFTPSGDGVYYFATVARDEFGKVEDDPTGVGDAATTYDTHISPTVGLAATPAGWTNTNAFTVTWDNPVDLSGIAGVRYSIDVPPASRLSGTFQEGQGITTLTGLTVTGDGVHTVWVWLVDNAGNVDHAMSRTTFLRYDATPPVNVTITATRHVSPTQFMVSWSAEDATSGVASYTVAYSNTTTSSWQNWLTGTTATSGTFQAPTVESDYVFRVTAYDRAGNSAMATVTTRVGAFRVYIPLMLRNWVWWYQYDTYEPNNTRAQAYGPLIAGKVYTSYIYTTDDQFDFYTLTVPSAVGQIVLNLGVPDCCDYDMYLYDAPTGSYIAASNYTGKGLDERIIYNNPQAGRIYYILVYSPYRDHSSAIPYSLQWGSTP